MKNAAEPVVSESLPKGYRAYKIKGVEQTIVAKKGGPSSEEVKTKPSYEELRNNQKEFGVASMMAKVLRESLSEGMSEICETYVSGKLTAQFRNLVQYEDGKTGRRPLYLSKYGHHLNGFEFNSTAPYDQIFSTKYFVKGGSSRGHVILHFPSFIPDKTFRRPEEATNFKISARLIALSDHRFNEAENVYTAINEEMHGKYGAFQTPMLPILKMATEPMTEHISIDVAQIPEETGLFLVMAVSFYQYKDGKFYHLPKGSGMSIKRVY